MAAPGGRPAVAATAQDQAAHRELARQEVDVSLAIEREAAKHAEEARHLRGHPAERLEMHGDWPILSRLPIRLTAAIPLPRFRVKDLLALECGQLIQSSWAITDDVPLKIGALRIGWSEFEVVEERMASRLTRLA